ERVETLDEAAQVIFTPGEGRGEGLGDVLNAPDGTPVEQKRASGQRLLGGGVCSTLVECDEGSVVQAAQRFVVGGRSQFDVHGPQQAGLAHCGGGLGREHHVAVYTAG